MKKQLLVVLLLLIVAFNLDAFETRLMLGGEYIGEYLSFLEEWRRPMPIPQPFLEIAVSTSPLSNKFQQEIGLRGGSLIFAGWANLVLRSWFLFPNASSQFIRERFKFGIEYSPIIIGYYYVLFIAGSTLFLGIVTAISTSICVSEPEKKQQWKYIYLLVQRLTAILSFGYLIHSG